MLIKRITKINRIRQHIIEINLINCISISLIITMQVIFRRTIIRLTNRMIKIFNKNNMELATSNTKEIIHQLM